VLVAADDPGRALEVCAVASRHESLREGVSCASSWVEARARLQRGADDACVVVWSPGSEPASELLHDASAQGWSVPLIVVTPVEDPAAEGVAMLLGVSQWLVRPALTALDLERAVRNAVWRAAVHRRLREREHTFRAAFEGGDEARLLVDDEGRCRDANAVARRVFALPAGDLVGVSLAALVGAVAHARLASLWAPQGPTPREATLRVQHPGGASVTYEASVVPRILLDCHLAVLRDVTSREEMRMRLSLSERMSSLGTLAAGMAHAINNPLQVIYTSVDLVQLHLDRARAADPGAAVEIDEALTEMAVAREAAERVQRVVRDLAVFTRADHGETSRVNLSVPLETAIRLTATTIRHRATLVKDIRPGASVTGNEAQLTQVFVHLLLNAAQAIPEGASAQNEVRVSLARVPDGRVQVTVSDTGHGMSPEVVAQVFDPFFTTRSVGEGVGLGLSVCHGTVTAMGGEILVESERGKGTTFRVILPVLGGSGRPATMTPIPVLDAVPRSHVLVIDDDPLVVRSLTRLLQGHHEVEALTDAREGLARVLSGERFDAILCDVMMPEMSGVDFYQALVARVPEQAARVVFVTGGAFSPETRAFLEAGQHRVVEKPVTRGTLFNALLRVLHEERGG
jgi:signal transduction histidine kinase/ActR/RegA family two-component response regulator